VAHLLADQAAGLRKLLNPRSLRTIAVASAAAGAGRTTVAVNLAVALAQKGCDVLIIDAATGVGSAAWLLDAEPGADLLDAWNNNAGVEQVVADAAEGVRVVRARAAWMAMRGAGDRRAADLAQLFHTLHPSAAVVLIDAPFGDPILTAAALETVVVAGPQWATITDTYRLVKRLHGRGSRRVHVLVNRVEKTAHGDMILGNLSSTSRRFLNLRLELIGQVPDDPRLSRAARLRQPVMEAFADASSSRALRSAADALLRDKSPGDDGFAEFANRLLTSARDLGPSN